MPPKSFQLLNGYSNKFWGWGGEDDQMYWRIKKMLKWPIIEPKKSECLFDMLEHSVHGETHNPVNPRAVKEIKEYKRYKLEGLNTLKYEIKFESDCKIFSHYMVDLLAPGVPFAKNHPYTRLVKMLDVRKGSNLK